MGAGVLGRGGRRGGGHGRAVRVPLLDRHADAAGSAGGAHDPAAALPGVRADPGDVPARREAHRARDVRADERDRVGRGRDALCVARPGEPAVARGARPGGGSGHVGRAHVRVPALHRRRPARDPADHGRDLARAADGPRQPGVRTGARAAVRPAGRGGRGRGRDAPGWRRDAPERVRDHRGGGRRRTPGDPAAVGAGRAWGGGGDGARVGGRRWRGGRARGGAGVSAAQGHAARGDAGRRFLPGVKELLRSDGERQPVDARGHRPREQAAAVRAAGPHEGRAGGGAVSDVRVHQQRGRRRSDREREVDRHPREGRPRARGGEARRDHDHLARRGQFLRVDPHRRRDGPRRRSSPIR